VTMFVLIGAGLCCFAEEQLDPATKARIEKYDKGPTTIDVSKYPPGIKSNYAVFRQKCSLCHQLSRPLNCDFALPDEWSRYVKRMMYKPGSGINPADGKKIYAFLAYDSSVRKPAMLAEKLAKTTLEEKTDAENKIKELHQEYDQK
jgi:cytochrome c